MKISTYFSLIFTFFILSFIPAESQTISTGHPTQTFTIGGSSVIIAPSLTVVSSGNLTSASVSIQSYQSGDFLDATNPQGLSENWNSSTKTLTLSGSASASVYQAALRTVTFSTSNAIDGTRSIDFILGSAVAYTINGKEHFYEVVANGSSLTWQQAESNAAARTFGGETGYLATITSAGENTFINNKVSQNSWIGASDDNPQTSDAEGEWYWVTGPESGTKFWTGGQTGSTITYSNWYSGEPNNAVGGEDYGHVYGTGGQAGYWNDFAYNNSGVSYYIVEYGGYTSSPASFSVSDYASIDINFAPNANNDGTYNVNTGGTVTGNVLTNDTDADGNDLDVTVQPTLTYGSFNSFNLETGAFEYLAPTNFAGTFSFQYTVTDGFATDNASASILVIDTIIPVVNTQNITTYLDNTGSASIVPGDIDNGSTDNIGITGLSLNITSFDCSDVGNNTVTLTVFDAAGNNAQGTATVTVLDTISPTAVCQNISIQLDNSNEATITAGDINNGSDDNCSFSLAIDKSFFTCLDVGDNTVILTATDASLNNSTCTATVTVQDTVPPLAVCQNITIEIDDVGDASILPGNINNGSSDNCGIVSYTLNQTSFVCGDVGDNSVILTIADATGNTDNCTATVTVQDNVPPEAYCQDDTIYLDASGNATASALNINDGSTDACGPLSYALNITAFSCADIGTNPVVLTVTDNNSNESTCPAIVTVADTTPPTAACNANITVELDENGDADITALDIDDGSNDNCGDVSLDISPMSFDCADTTAANTVTLTVTDDSGNTATCTTNVTVDDNLAPDAVCEDITIELDANGDASIIADDVDGGSTDNCGVADISVDITAFTCDDLGGNPVVLTVTDYSGNQDNCTATVTVEDNLGIVAECHDTIVYLDSYGHRNVPASWIDDGSWDNCIDESNFNMTLIPNSFNCADTGIVDVQLTVYDGMGDFDVCGAQIDVRDSTPPEVYCHPITVELDSSGNYSLTDANVHAINVPDSTRDNCTPDADLAFWVLPNTYDCDDADNGADGDVVVTLYAADVSGNIGTCETIVTVEDNQIPVAECKDITIYLDHFGDQSIAHDSVDNGSFDNCDITYLTSQVDFECTDECSNTGETCNVVTLTVTDQVGNFATCESTVTVRDTVLPDMFCKDITVYLDVNGEVSIAHDSIDDGSWDACGIYSYETSQVDFTCADECSNGWDDPCNIVTLTVTDNNGNTDQCTAEVEVIDTVTPEMICHDITIDLADIDYLDPANGTFWITPDTIDVNSNDACGLDSMWLTSYFYDCDSVCTNIAGDILAPCPTVTLTVRDENFNTSTCTQIVTVRDNDAPHAECQDVTVYLDSTGYGEITAINGTDSIPQIDSEVGDPSWDNCSIDTMWLDQYKFYCADIDTLVGTHTITMTVRDIHENTSTCESTVTVLDTVKPAVICQDVTVYLSDIQGSDNSALIIADPVIVADNNVLADWYDNCEVKFELDTSIYYCADVGIHTATITATDSTGNIGTCEATVTVEDSTPPHVLTQDITVCLDVDGNFSITPDTINDGSWDNCGIDSTWLDTYDYTCADIGDHTVTLTVLDVHGNTASATASVAVRDCMAPDVQCSTLTVTLYENGEYVLNENDIAVISEGTTDNCTAYEDLIIDVVDKSFECIHVFGDSVAVVVSATDEYGNTGTCETFVIVKDITKPTMKCKEVVDVYLDNTGSARIYPTLLNDGNDVIAPEWARTYNHLAGGSYDACGIDSAWVDQTIFTCDDLDSVEVELFMIDPSLNKNSCTTIVVVHDTLAPTIAPVSDVQLVIEPGACDGEIVYPTILADDNCSTIIELESGLGADGDFPVGTTTETWKVTDDAGNTAMVSFDVTIVSSNALPTIDEQNDIAVNEDTYSVSVDLTGISDGGDCEEQDVDVSVERTNEALVTDITLTYVAGESTATVDMLVAPDMSGSSLITVTVTDSEGGVTTEEFMVNVGIENDAPFLVNPIPDQTVHASHVLKVPISPVLGDIFDDIDNSSLNISVTPEDGGDLPLWATIVGDTLIGEPLIADTGCVNIVVTATDAGGLSVSDTFEVCVDGFPVSIDELSKNQFEVQMYPNPTRGEVNLEISSGIYSVDLSVHDITGKVVLRKQYSAAEKMTFDMSGKVSGMYFVRLNVDGNQIVKKLVVNKK